MTGVIITIHIIVCISLILIVLLQTGKGAGMGSAFGGGSSQTVFGGSGPASFLAKFTTIAAIIFMLTSLSLSYFSGNRLTKSIMADTPQEESRPIIPEVNNPEKQQTDAESQNGNLP